MRIFFISVILLLASVSTVFAQGGETYTPMVGVPGLPNSGSYSTQDYIKALYALSISVGALLAVIQIIFGGVQYMFDGVVTHKSEALKKIRGAVLGLLIILSAVLILETINPVLKELRVFVNAPPIERIAGAPKPLTACQTAPNSKACCSSQGGTYIVYPAGSGGGRGGARCSTGDIVTLPEGAGETLEEKRVFCESTPGREWVGGKCRETAGKATGFPPGWTDADGKDDFDRAEFCSRAYGGNYNPDTDTCISTQ